MYKDNLLVMRLLLIRHGQTEWNSEGRWQGTIDTPLSAIGITQAEALAAYLQANEPGIVAVYSSLLQRAKVTAQIVADALGVAVHHDARLQEIHLGAFQGLTTQEMDERYPTEFAEMHKGELAFTFPEGESRQMLYDRAHAVMHDIRTAHPDQTIAVVTHAGVKRMIMRRLMGDEVSKQVPSIGNTSLTILESDPDSEFGWHLMLAASTAHLAAAAGSAGDSL